MGSCPYSPKKIVLWISYPIHGWGAEYPREKWANLPQVVVGAELSKPMLLHDDKIVVAFHAPDCLERPVKLFDCLVQLLQFLAEWMGMRWCQGLDLSFDLALTLWLNLIEVGSEEIKGIAVLA